MAPGSPQDTPAASSNILSNFWLKHKTRIVLCLFYFFFETPFSFKLFFLPVYWQQLGLSPTQIGILRAVWGVAYTAGAAIFGQVANSCRIRRALLLMSVLSTITTPLLSLIPHRTHDKCSVELRKTSEPAIARRASISEGNRTGLLSRDQIPNGVWFNSNRELSFSRLPRERQLPVDTTHVFVLKKSQEDINNIFIIFIFIVFFGEFLASPAFNLANSEIVEFLGENSSDYGKIRLWGPIGHIVAAPLTAVLVTHFHSTLCGEYQDNFAIAFIAIAVMATAAFVCASQFGKSSDKADKPDAASEAGGESVTLWQFLCRYQNFVFTVMTFLLGCFDGVVLTFGFWYTKTLSVTRATIIFGVSRMTCATVSVVFLGAVGMCVRKTGYPGVIVFAALLFVCWFVGMSLINNPWFMVIFETIGYIAYVVGFTGLISYFGEVTPRHLMDTVQGGVNSLFLGVGCGIGTALCGFLIDSVGAVSAFRLCAAGTVVLLVLFLLSQIPYCSKCFKPENKDAEK